MERRWRGHTSTLPRTSFESSPAGLTLARRVQVPCRAVRSPPCRVLDTCTCGSAQSFINGSQGAGREDERLQGHVLRCIAWRTSTPRRRVRRRSPAVQQITQRFLLCSFPGSPHCLSYPGDPLPSCPAVLGLTSTPPSWRHGARQRTLCEHNTHIIVYIDNLVTTRQP